MNECFTFLENDVKQEFQYRISISQFVPMPFRFGVVVFRFIHFDIGLINKKCLLCIKRPTAKKFYVKHNKLCSVHRKPSTLIHTHTHTYGRKQQHSTSYFNTLRIYEEIKIFKPIRSFVHFNVR